MSTATADLEVKTYLALVASHLQDLPEAERDDLLEDLEQHLAEVAAEEDGSLVERLGPPEAYAVELRSSAGYPPERGLRSRRVRRVMDRLERSWIWRIARAAPVRAVREFLPELRPGWWVLRGYLAVAAPWIVSQDYSKDVNLLIPGYFGSPLVGLVAIGGAIRFSVALGRRAPASGGARNLTRAANLAVVLVGIAAASHIQTVVPAYAGPQYVPDYLHHADGSAIYNLCPYAADGAPLDGVLLFDQDGRPVTNLGARDYHTLWPDGSEGPAPADPVAAIPNAYPQPQSVVDERAAQWVEFSCPKVIVPRAPAGRDREPAPQPSAPAGREGAGSD